MADQESTEAIRQRAYEIWVSEGCPSGRDCIHWLRAEAEFRERLAAAHASGICKTGLHEAPAKPARTPHSAKPTKRKSTGTSEKTRQANE